MSITLHASGERQMTVNVWNWGVLHHIVARLGSFPHELWEPMRYNGGGDLDADQVRELAELLETKVLAALSEGERIFFDGTVTAEPDDGTLYRAEDERWKNYSLQRDVLENVVAFLRAANGPVSIL
jgi:hypothetical protein